jgi:hypothetical protein
MSIISASRRTDLPRWYLDQTLVFFEQGYVELVNPFNQQPYRVDLTRENVKCIVWWSKDYQYYLENREAVKFFSKFNQLFQFTINGYQNWDIAHLLEPGVTSSLDERIGQVRQLARVFSPQQVLWRFDPITFWKTIGGEEMNNTVDFPTISEALGNIGIKRCHIAFADLYAKFKKRAMARFGNKVMFHEETIEKKREIAHGIAIINKYHGITTYSCAHDEIVNEDDGIFKAHCIDGELINLTFNLDMGVKKDPGQRNECGCAVSKDIGRYDQKCKHCCVYCYANPDDK